jgi:hypothetical protein
LCEKKTVMTFIARNLELPNMFDDCARGTVNLDRLSTVSGQYWAPVRIQGEAQKMTDANAELKIEPTRKRCWASA